MVRKHLRRTFANFHGAIGWLSAQNRLAYTCKIVKSSSVGKWDKFETCYLWLYFWSYMILNGCYVSVGLFCTVCNDIYSKMFIFGSIMTKNEQKWTFFKSCRIWLLTLQNGSKTSPEDICQFSRRYWMVKCPKSTCLHL